MCVPANVTKYPDGEFTIDTVDASSEARGNLRTMAVLTADCRFATAMFCLDMLIKSHLNLHLYVFPLKPLSLAISPPKKTCLLTLYWVSLNLQSIMLITVSLYTHRRCL